MSTITILEREIPLLRVIASLAAALGSYGALKLVALIYSRWDSTLRILPGPPNPSFIFGNAKQIWKATDPTETQDAWREKYGKTYAYTELLNSRRLYTMDLKALHHVFTNNYIYRKATNGFNLGALLDNGLVFTEGDMHKNQRRIMNPGFGPAQIRDLTHVFVEKSVEIGEAWQAEIAKQGETADINAMQWFNRMALDSIGLAGFNFNFNAVADGEEESELARAFTQLFASIRSMSFILIIRGMFPLLRWIPSSNDGVLKNAQDTMDRIGKELIANSKNELMKAGNIEKDSVKSRDLLSLLIRANMTTDHAGHQRMSDAEVLAQVPTFLVAGHETTGTGTSWAFYALSRAPHVQQKLREECLTLSPDNVTMDDLNSLPYLDFVLREILRLYPPVPNNLRIAAQDDILPLATPIKDLHGNVHNHLHIRKGESILIPIEAVNKDPAIWGEDSHEFRPERWESIPPAASSVPAVWGNMLTFIGGPRACIGYRFSIVEMKALIFTLVRKFEFELAAPVEEIVRRPTIVQRPYLRSDPNGPNNMPLRVKLYQG